jgi:hypothetical protein
MNRRIAPLFVIAVLAAFMAACSSQNTQPQAPAISLAINTMPPSSLDMNATAQIAATVTNDSANEGVDWTCAPASSCGTFTPTHTASGANTTYQASNTAGTVTITAVSTADASVKQSATITINALTISITTMPPSGLDMSATAQIAATVANDLSNAGVDWSCTPVSSCGTFTPTHTASGANTTYQASNTAGTVTITGASTTESSVTKSVTVTINPITISTTTAPPSSMDMNTTAQIAAAVANDFSNAGVDWSCTPVSSCGTFTPTHSASGANTTYHAPNTAATVTITAASTTEPTVTKSVTVTISPITVSIATAPPSSMEINASAQIAATVANDLPNAGVDWSCAPVSSCGTFTPAHTASAADTTYQAPNAAGTVTITAKSTTEPTVTQSLTVTINPVGTTSSLKGTYTYYANGWDSIFDPYSVVGSIVLDGNGNVIGGEQDYFDLASDVIDTADPIASTGGTITLGADGRGTLKISLTNRGKTETFSVALVNNDHLLITEFDSSATSAGSMDLQTSPTTVPTGGNAFALYDVWNRYVIGGVVTARAGTAAEEYDKDFAGSQSFDQTHSGDTISPPDAAGRGTMTLVGLQCAYYVVGPETFRVIEIDGNTFGGMFFSGSMYGQGSAAGALSPASLKGSYVFVQGGQDNNPNGIFEYGVAGEFTTDASSTLTAGVADVNEGDAPVFAASLAGSTYTVNSNGYGSVTLATALDGNLQNFGAYLVDPALNMMDPNSTTGGGGAVLLDLDANNFGIGVIVPQSSGAVFAGNYAFNQDGNYQTVTLNPFLDIVGQVLSDGTSMLAGKADFNDLGNTGLNPDDTITATFTPDSVNAGRSTAQVNISSGGITTENITLYQASDDLIFHVDMDSPGVGLGNSAIGVFEKQQ